MELMVASGDSWADEMDNLPTARMSPDCLDVGTILMFSRAEGSQLWT